MLRSYLKIALRQLWRNRLFSLINILGHTVGWPSRQLHESFGREMKRQLDGQEVVLVS